MTESGAQAGWYDDPHVPGQVRYFDGTRWTEHTSSAPVVAASPVGTASPYGDGAAWPLDPSLATASSYPSSVVPGGWVPVQHHSPPSQGWSTRTVLLVVGAAVVAGLVVLGGVIGLARLAESRQLASGPPLALTDSAPMTVVGRAPATGPVSADVRTHMAPMIAKAFAGLPGSGPSHVELYGPGTRSAPPRGRGYVVLLWMRVAKPFDQNSFATGMLRGLTQASAGATNQTFAEANGGTTVCSQSRPAAGGYTMVICAWIRSGTGLVVTIEYDVPVDVVLADNRGVVTSMAHLV